MTSHLLGKLFKPDSHRQPQEQSQRNRLIRLLMGGTVLISSFCAYYSYQLIRRDTLKNIKHSAFLEVQNRADTIDMWLHARRAEIQTMANVPPSQSLDWAVIGPYLKTEATRIYDFELLGFSDLNGWRYTTADDRRVNARDRRWFQEAIAGRTYVDDPFISRAIGVPIIAISAPIRAQTLDNREPIGVIHGGVKVDLVIQVVERLRSGQGSYAFLLNSEGRAIVHPDRTLMSTVEHQAPSLIGR
ncbi:MAG: two-component system sensor histidine kinase/response regulator, partial [Leptolyngbya sp. SIO1D8]|nr:two-component system sensor histidine kinase/response regulator [Leptolyngbya sp. SIO1D8]